MKSFTAAFIISLMFTALTWGQQINEIRIDQSGTDTDEYAEIKATPGSILTNVWYLVIGDHSDCGIQGAPPPTKGSGVVELAVPLVDFFGNPLQVPASGFVLMTNNSFRASPNQNAQTVAAINIEIGSSGMFENSDNVTHMLVVGYTGGEPVITCDDQLGDDAVDIDTDDDSVADVFPWTSILDAVSAVETPNPVPNNPEDPNFAEGIYAVQFGGVNVGPDGNFAPAHLYRSASSGEWQIGEFAIDAATAVDTPGSPNPIDSVLINEVRLEQPGADDDEYFELRGTPGDPLDGLTYIVLGDGDGGSGVIEEVVDLSGQTIPGSGYFVAAETNFDLGTADLSRSLNFEGSDNVTHILAWNFTGADGDDLDTDDDGVLDVTPWSFIFDVVSFVEADMPPTSGSEYPYGSSLGGENVGPDGSFLPGHAYRDGESLEWRVGIFDPASANDTPGAANPAQALDITLQPQSVAIESGETATLTVEAEGAAPFTYQWYQGVSGDTSMPVADPSIQDSSDIFSTITFFNGDDAVALKKDGGLIDVIGIIGSDPGSEWGSGDTTTGEHTIRRNSDVISGDATGFNDPGDITNEWTGFPQDTLDGLGSHMLDNGLTATDLFFSEYVEGSGNNKAVEIYNGTGAAVDLTGYTVELYSNGSTDAGNTLALTDVMASLPAGATIVIGNASGSGADNIFTTPSLTTTTSYWVRVFDQSAQIDSETATVSVQAMAAPIQINEIRIDQSGSNDDDEYFELKGDPSASLDGLTYLVIGDGTGGSGVIEAVVDLNGQSLDGNGFFVVAEDTFTIGTSNLVSSLNFENSDNVTHLLVEGFTGSNADDLDTNDDGVLDAMPWTSVFDAISLVEDPNVPPSGTEYAYAISLGFENIGPDGTFVPGHVYRDGDTGVWTIGVFDLASPDVKDTPGAENPSASALDITLSNSTVDENQPAGTVVGTLTAVGGSGSEVFSLVAGDGDDDNGSFAIDGSNLETAAVLDHEAQDTYSVRIMVTDGDTFTKVFAITTNDDRTEDADNDGLTEAEEEDTYGTSDTNPDSDGDGTSDSDEVNLWMTSPTDNSDVVMVASPTISNDEITFSWSTVIGVTYKIQSTTSLAPAVWTDVPGTTFVADETSESVTIDLPVAESTFYRIVAVDPGP